VTRDAQLAALSSRIKCYDEAAMRSHDPTIITGFKDAARNLLEHRQKMVAEPLVVGQFEIFDLRANSGLAPKINGTIQPSRKVSHIKIKIGVRIASGNLSNTFAIAPSGGNSRAIALETIYHTAMPSHSSAPPSMA
jgi:hypothetical protein